MNRFESRLRGKIVRIDGQDPNREVIGSIMDVAVLELERLEAQEIDASTNLRTGEFTLTISLESGDLLDAQEAANSYMRSAFHAAGVGTPDWSIDWVESCVVPEGHLIAV